MSQSFWYTTTVDASAFVLMDVRPDHRTCGFKYIFSDVIAPVVPELMKKRAALTAFGVTSGLIT